MSQDDPRPVVLLVEDEALVRLTLGEMLEESGFRVLSVVSPEEALEVLGHVPAIRALVTDVELSSGSMNGFGLARKVGEEYGLPAVVLSGRAGPEPDDLTSGVHFVAKPVHQATLARLVRDLIEDHATPEQPASLNVPDLERPASHNPPDAESDPRWGLTPRQHEVLALLMQGKSNQQIAEALGLSPNTVKVHLVTIFKILGVSSRTEALLAGMRRSLRK
ncbi:MAG TPA: response regulator transcription factor [Microvirga sp.]|jgi:DNA-binding NarL/FixJ family response regulator|nr:response regulator transcription factor [Microvirga sp.]